MTWETLHLQVVRSLDPNTCWHHRVQDEDLIDVAMEQTGVAGNLWRVLPWEMKNLPHILRIQQNSWSKSSNEACDIFKLDLL